MLKRGKYYIMICKHLKYSPLNIQKKLHKYKFYSITEGKKKKGHKDKPHNFGGASGFCIEDRLHLAQTKSIAIS